MYETSMVVEHIDTEEQYAILGSPKTNSRYKVSRDKGKYHFFKVMSISGITPQVLSGHYSSLDNGIKAVKQYLDNSKETFAVKSERLDKERKERHAAKANSSDSK